MRHDHNFQQLRLDTPGILEMDLNLKSRHELVPLLQGLQELYRDDRSRNEVFDLVRKDVLGKSSAKKGRQGLDIWSIAVLATARLGLNLDYDALQDLAENHQHFRSAMGVGEWQTLRRLDWRRIRDCVCMLRPETLTRISEIVVSLGHTLVPNAAEKVRIDSFVMATNIHYPTDIRQTGDALRCLVRHSARLADLIGSSTMRQHEHLQKRIKSLVLIASRASVSRGRARQKRLEEAVRELVTFANERCEQSMRLMDEVQPVLITCDDMTRSDILAEREKMAWFLSALAQVAHVAKRRLVDGEDVPLSDRLFSVFEAHTELIVRGKVPVPVEFGHRILVAEDSAGFILHASVLANGRQDREVAPTVARILKRRYQDIETLSFDRGFHSPENQERLAKIIPTPCLPTTGIQAATEQAEAASEAWHAARRRHPGIESAIGALQHGNGCARCRDKTKNGYRRYLALGVLARNLITLGRIAIAQQDEEALAGRSRRKVA